MITTNITYNTVLQVRSRPVIVDSVCVLWRQSDSGSDVFLRYLRLFPDNNHCTGATYSSITVPVVYVRPDQTTRYHNNHLRLNSTHSRTHGLRKCSVIVHITTILNILPFKILFSTIKRVGIHIPLEMVRVAQLVKKFPVFYGGRKFIPVLIRVRCWSLHCEVHIDMSYFFNIHFCINVI
jgi:hypothetical protein